MPADRPTFVTRRGWWIVPFAIVGAVIWIIPGAILLWP